MDPAHLTQEPVFDSYTIHEETFKTVSSHPIKTAILIPKHLKPGSHPLIYHLHGGFFIMAHSLFAAGWEKWMNKLALEHGAIVVSPDHRLLPSANGMVDVLEDIEDGWVWARSKLNTVLKEKMPGFEVEFGQTLVAGGSAGGHLAVSLGLSHPEQIQSVAVVYPLIDPKDHLYNSGPTESDGNILRLPSDYIPSKEDTLAWIEETRKQITSKSGFERAPFAVGACHHGLYGKLIFDNLGLQKREFYPLERIEAGEKLPKNIWVLQGREDSTCPIRGSDKFVDLVKAKLPETNIRYDIVDTGDHGFDYDESSWESFSREALGFVVKGWLGA